MYLITPNQLQTILLTHFSLLVRVWLRGYSECCWSRWHHLPELYGFSETGTYRGNRETCQRSLFVTLISGLPFMLVLHHLTIVMLKWLPFLYLVHVVGFVLVMLISAKQLEDMKKSYPKQVHIQPNGLKIGPRREFVCCGSVSRVPGPKKPSKSTW